MSFTLSEILKSGFWILMQKFILRLLSFVSFIALARFLEPESYALIGIALAALNLLQVIANYGMPDAIIQRTELTESVKHSAFWMCIVSGIIISLSVILLLPFILSYLNLDAYYEVYFVMAVLLPINSIEVLPRTLLRRQLAYDKIIFCATIPLACGYIVAIILAWQGFGVWSLVAQQVVFSFLRAVLFYRVSGWQFKLQFSIRDVKELRVFGRNILGSKLLSGSYDFAAKSFIGAFLGANILGYYVFSNQLMGSLGQLCKSSLFELVLPVFSRIKNDLVMVREYCENTYRIAFSISAPIFCALVITSDTLIPMIFGDQWRPCVIFIQLMALSNLLGVWFLFGKSVIESLGKPQNAFIMVVVNTLAGLLMLVLLAPHGLELYLLAQLLWTGIFNMIFLIMLKHHIRLRWVSLLKLIVPSAVSTGIMALVLLLMEQYLNLQPLWLNLTLHLGVALLLYLAIISLLEYKEFKAAWDYVKGRLIA